MPVTEYLWDVDNDSLLMETDGDGNPTAVYTNTPDPNGELISQHRDGQTYFHHYDGEHNTRQVTYDSQNVGETATYSAFGETVAKTSSIVNPFGYKGALGYYTNGETGDVYVRARTFSPTIGRWLTRDPIGWLGGLLNLYGYAAANPVANCDPSGLRIGLWGYGEYCGLFLIAPCLGVDQPRPGINPIDDIDAACAKHDCCLMTAVEFANPCRQFSCNWALCTAIKNANCSKSPVPWQCRLFQFDMAVICQQSPLSLQPWWW